MGSCREREVMPAAGIDVVPVNQPERVPLRGFVRVIIAGNLRDFSVTNALIDALAWPPRCGPF